jgi:hypothetical protein
MSRKPRPLCPACQDVEMVQASACYERCRAAEARGEVPACECPPLVCEHGVAPQESETPKEGE